MRHTFRISVLLVVLAFLAVACGGGSDESGGNSTTTTADGTVGSTLPDTTEPSDDGDDGGSSGAGFGGALSPGDFLAGASDLESYSFEMTMSFEGQSADGENILRTAVIDAAFIADPPGSTLTISMEGMEEETDVSFSMVQTEGTAYTVIPGLGCVSGPADDPNMMNPFEDAFFVPDDMFDGLGDLDSRGTTTFEGIEVEEYVFDATQIIPGTGEEITSGEGHFYVSTEYNVVVAFDLDGEGTFGMFEDGDIGAFHLGYRVTGINEPVDLAIPDECASGSGGAGSDLPILADASNVSSLPGITTYTSQTSLDEAVAFYQTELADAGWSESGDTILSPGSALLNFEMGGEALFIAILEYGADITVTLTTG